MSSDELVSMRQTFAPLRQDTIWMLRYLRPQLQALEGLQRWSETEASIHGGQELLSADALARCREARFELASLVAELEAQDASGAVLHDELVALASEQIGQSDNIIAKLGLALDVLVCGARARHHHVCPLDLNAYPLPRSITRPERGLSRRARGFPRDRRVTAQEPSASSYKRDTSALQQQQVLFLRFVLVLAPDLIPIRRH